MVDEEWLCHGDDTGEALDGSQMGLCTDSVLDSSDYEVDGEQVEEEVGDARQLHELKHDDCHEDEATGTGTQEEEEEEEHLHGDEPELEFDASDDVEKDG